MNGLVQAGALALTVTGTINEASGTIVASSLTGSADTANFFATNTIATLGGFTSTNGFNYYGFGTLTVTGPVTDGHSIVLSAAGTTPTTVGALVLNGVLTAPNVDLSSDGAITQPGGSIVASQLSGYATGVTLGQPNAVGTLDTFLSTGSFLLADAIPLSVVATVQAAGTSPSTLTLAADTLTIASTASLSAPNGVIVLQPFAPTDAMTLSGGGGGSESVNFVANSIVVGGPSAASVAIAGQFDFTTVPTLSLQSAGTVSETGTGSFAAHTVVGQVGGLALAGANQIATIGSLSAAGSITLVNTSDLAITGPLGAGTIFIVETGSLTAPGAVTTAFLAGSATGSASFTGSNTIGALGSFTSVGGLTPGRYTGAERVRAGIGHRERRVADGGKPGGRRQRHRHERHAHGGRRDHGDGGCR